MQPAHDTPSSPAFAAYRELEQRFRRMNLLRDAAAILDWDAATVMPTGGVEARGDQLATLRVLRHELLTAPAMEELLARAGEAAELDPWQRANLREMRREWIHATAVPASLVEARSQAVTACEMRWRTARRENDFRGLLPHLEKVLALTRETAAAKAARLGVAPYDALLDEYEPDGRAEEIDRVFAALEGFLPALVDRVLEAQARRPEAVMPPGPFPVAQQRALAERLMRQIGFDFEHGRLDTSDHPFCGGVPDDVRITTRYEEHSFLRSLFGVLHETGHALYERQLPRAWRYQPVGQARGMSMHESQSLLVEMQACRSAEFLGYLAPVAREAFGGQGPAWEAGNLARLVTRVARGLIRIDADEVTYPLHVILRYRLERALIAGELSLADLPGAWNELMAKLVGVRPPDDRTGCLQDIHWPGGAWGYFPTYTLGAMTAAQLFAAAVAASPGIPAELSRGEFGSLRAWLATHVHGQASVASTREILVRATGRPLDPAVFRAHLERRYL
jgi:carboxypeptidase Taq